MIFMEYGEVAINFLLILPLLLWDTINKILQSMSVQYKSTIFAKNDSYQNTFKREYPYLCVFRSW